MNTNTYQITSPDGSIDRTVSALSRQEALDQVAWDTNYIDGDLVATLCEPRLVDYHSNYAGDDDYRYGSVSE